MKLKLTDLACFASQFSLGIPDPCFPEPWDCRVPGVCVSAECPSSVFYTCTGNSLVYLWGHCFSPLVWNDDLNLLSVIFNSSI